MKRTTILADEGLWLEAKYLADREGKTFTHVIHEALAEYVAAHSAPRRLPDFIGMGHSGDPTLAQRVDEILAAEIDPIEGWSPRRKREKSEENHPSADSG